MNRKKWTGYKTRPTNRAKTWGKKDRDPRKERRNAKRDLRGSSRLMIVRRTPQANYHANLGEPYPQVIHIVNLRG